jgi:hypothetical protein
MDEETLDTFEDARPRRPKAVFTRGTITFFILAIPALILAVAGVLWVLSFAFVQATTPSGG